jgi:hypothetical protein
MSPRKHHTFDPNQFRCKQVKSTSDHTEFLNLSPNTWRDSAPKVQSGAAVLLESNPDSRGRAQKNYAPSTAHLQEEYLALPYYNTFLLRFRLVTNSEIYVQLAVGLLEEV